MLFLTSNSIELSESYNVTVTTLIVPVSDIEGLCDSHKLHVKTSGVFFAFSAAG